MNARRSSLEDRSTWEQGCSDVLAALDLGSNSFHLIIARVCGTEVRVLRRERDVIRLAAGLDAGGRLNAAAQARALETLARFRERLNPVRPQNIRAVGTNTLRRARNGPEFLRQAQAALRHPIEIISGQEEARLIYLGVAWAAANDLERRLVIDIGGGSTELILGEGLNPITMESLPLGCVTFTRRFFPDGKIRPEAMVRAEKAVHRTLQPLAGSYGQRNWRRAVGSSGTIKTVRRILKYLNGRDKGIRPADLARLRQALLDCGRVEGLAFRGLDPERAPVLPAGVAILSGIFSLLQIGCLQVSKSTLREGLLYEMVLGGN